MQYLEIKTDAHGSVAELTDFLASLGITELVIEDGAEFADILAESEPYWDSHADGSDLSRSLVTFYLPSDEDGRLRYAVLERALACAGWETSCTEVHSEDWEYGWQKYYQPMPVGKRLMVIPDWLDPPEDGENRVPLRLDPGLIFGTGSHPTTRMCLEALEDTAAHAEKVLDLGCGSGILAIASVLLGAKSACGVDIDPLAPDVAVKNAALNGIGADRFSALCGDVADFAGGGFDLVLANIIADVILGLLPSVPSLLSEKGRFVCSGIIEGREAEIEAAARSAGLTVLEHRQDSDWHCYVMSTGSEGNA